MYTKLLRFPIIFCFLALLASCGAAHQNAGQEQRASAKFKPQTVAHQQRHFLALDSVQTLLIGGHLVDVIQPSGEVKGNIIVLPGWDFSRKDWCQKSSLCTQALARGYRLVLPEMARSVYSAEYYIETRTDWLRYPNKAWCTDSLVPALQQRYGILLPEQKNFILGLSTGGRGVALLCLALPELFTAAAALYSKFPERWKGADNPVYQADKFQTPIYLGHGKRDGIVPFQQTILFYEALRKAKPELTVVLNTPEEAGHDYDYWDAEVVPMLDFFESFLPKH
jgi:pimeloyl-ACP methyl ester carboxylesterase